MVSFIVLLAVSELASDKSGLPAASSGWNMSLPHRCVFLVTCKAGAIAVNLNSRLFEEEALQVQTVVCGVPHL